MLLQVLWCLLPAVTLSIQVWLTWSLFVLLSFAFVKFRFRYIYLLHLWTFFAFWKVITVVAMVRYSKKEDADVLLDYRQVHSTEKARWIYRELYRNRRIPNTETFSNIYKKLRRIGHLNLREPRLIVWKRDIAVDENILRAFNDHPTSSSRKVAADLGISSWKVW